METNDVRTTPLNLLNFPIQKYPIELWCGIRYETNCLSGFLMSMYFFQLNFSSSVLYTVYFFSC